MSTSVAEITRVLMDALEEVGDTEGVEALRNLDRLKKLPAHWDRLKEWIRDGAEYDDGYCRGCYSWDGGHDRDCEMAGILRYVLGAEEEQEQFDALWDLAIAEKARRERPPNPNRFELHGLNEVLKAMYPPQVIMAEVAGQEATRRATQITGLAAWLPEVPPSPDNLFNLPPPEVGYDLRRPLAPPLPVISVIADKNVPDGIAYMLPSQRATAVMDLFKTPMTAAEKLNAAERLLNSGLITRDDFTKILNTDPGKKK